MKVQKYELVRVIDKLKSIVQKNDQNPALSGILVHNGYLIAANGELTVMVKLKASAGEEFILPLKSFDLIKNLPDGEVEIQTDAKNIITIKMQKIKNKYQSFPAIDFIYRKEVEEMKGAEATLLPGEKLMNGMSHVIHASNEKSPNAMMNGIYFDGGEEALTVVATDGHVLACDKIPCSGTSKIKMLIPKAAAKKLVSMDVIDDVRVQCDANSAVFSTDEYAIYTRLIYLEGQYYPYQKMFQDMPLCAKLDRKTLTEAMTRAKMCTEEGKPAVFDIKEAELKITISDKVTDYTEEVPLQDNIDKPIRIGFNSLLVLETIKAFSGEKVTLNLNNPVMPMIVREEESDMKSLVLPVRLGK